MLIQSFSSACYHLGWKKSANKMSTIKHKFENVALDKQIAMFREEVAKRVPELICNRVQIFNSRKPLDIFSNTSPFTTLVIPIGSDQGIQHAITIVNNLVFDSNVEVAMHLCKETLDWCTNTPGGYQKVYYAMRFHIHSKEYKIQRKYADKKRKYKEIAPVKDSEIIII